MNVYRTIIYVLLLGQFPVATTYIKEVANVVNKLLETFLKNGPSTEHMAVEGKVPDDFTFDEYIERLITNRVEALDIKDFDQVVNHLHSQLSMSEEAKQEILFGKYVQRNMKAINDFYFRMPYPGRFLCGRVKTVRRGSGKEIDLAYAFYKVHFKLSKKEVYKHRGLIFQLFHGTNKEIGYEDRALSREAKEHLTTYLQKKCKDSLVDEYPSLIDNTVYTRWGYIRDEL